MSRALALIGLLALAEAPGRAATTPPSAGPVKVHLTAPRPGWTHQRVVNVRGTVSDPRISVARVALNGVDRPINVHGGKFEARLVVPPGEDAIEVTARGEKQAGRDAVSFYADVPPTDVLVVLSWDTDGTDLDLHVTDPASEECYYGNRHTQSGGALEVDDTDGYGPEIFAQPQALPGTYHVAVAYYDAADAPETNAEVQVIVRQGTAAERRYRFALTLTKEGEDIEVGTFRVEPLGG